MSRKSAHRIAAHKKFYIMKQKILVSQCVNCEHITCSKVFKKKGISQSAFYVCTFTFIHSNLITLAGIYVLLK